MKEVIVKPLENEQKEGEMQDLIGDGNTMVLADHNIHALSEYRKQYLTST